MPNHLLEPDAEKVYAFCDHCGGEIYEGETIYAIDGNHIHEDCFDDFARELYSDCRKEAVCHE